MFLRKMGVMDRSDEEDSDYVEGLRVELKKISTRNFGDEARATSRHLGAGAGPGLELDMVAPRL